MLVIDGQAKTIQLSADQLDYTAGFIYSRWKDWVQESDNAKFLEAFRVVGGDDLGGGSRTPAFIFCLLYTSPSPRDRTRSRMPSSA